MFLYEALLLACLAVLRGAAALSSNARLGRFVAMRGAAELARSCARIEAGLAGLAPGARVVWIHVASVGEMEQAIPVARALHGRAGVAFLLTYFSPSAEAYLGNFPAAVAAVPLPLDVRSRHARILAAIRERATCEHLILVRYDLWPGLIAAANGAGLRVSLLAATARKARGGLAGLASRAAARFLLRGVSTVFTVAETDLTHFARVAPRARLLHAGDPKWARAKERADALRTQGLGPALAPLAALCRAFQARAGRVFVFGSPHAEEREVALRCSALPGALVVYVPHDPSEGALAALEEECRARGIEPTLLSRLGTSRRLQATPDSHHAYRNAGPSHPSHAAPYDSAHVPPRVFTPHPFGGEGHTAHHVDPLLPDFAMPTREGAPARLVVVDHTGLLAEIYALADAAIVGGGFDGQIHNTLEPAAHPVPVLIGDRLARSPEAEALVREGAARAFAAPEPLFQFLHGCVRVAKAAGGEGPPSAPAAVLVELRLRALELFKSVPSTSEVVSAALFETPAAPTVPTVPSMPPPSRSSSAPG